MLIVNTMKLATLKELELFKLVDLLIRYLLKEILALVAVVVLLAWLGDNMIDLDSITVDPLKIVEIDKETNKALAQHARQMQKDSTDILDASAELRNLKTQQNIQDINLDIIAAQEQGNVLEAAETTAKTTQQGMDAVRTTLAQKLNQMSELQVQMQDPELGMLQKWKLSRQYNKVDQQAGALYKSVLATQMVQNQARQQAGLEVKLSQDRTTLKKQANDNIHNIERSLRLADKIEQQTAKIQADSAIVQTLQARQKIDPNSLRAGKDESAMKDVLEYMYYLRNGTTDGYNDSQAKAMRVIFETLQDDASRRGIMLGSTEYLKGKLTGVQLSPDEYVQHFMDKGEINGLKVVATLREDTDLLDSIALGQQKVFENIYTRRIADAESKLDKTLDPNAELSAQQQRDIYNQSMAELEGMNARDIMGAAQNAISSDITTSTMAAGGDIYSRISESPADMLPPQMHSAQMRDFFNTPAVKQTLAIPDQQDGSPLISTSAKLVELARKQINQQGKRAFSDQEIYAAVADMNSNAAMANYKYGNGSGRTRESKAIKSLETAGVRFQPKLMVEMPRTSKILQPGVAPPRLDITNRIDLQKAVEELSAVRKAREQNKPADKLQRNFEAGKSLQSL